MNNRKKKATRLAVLLCAGLVLLGGCKDLFHPEGPKPLSAPSWVNASAQSSSSIYVSWDSVSGAEGYYVYRANSSDGYYSYITTATAYDTSYTDTGLSSSTTYYYKVSAYNDSDEEGLQSSSTSATTSEAAPFTPTSISAAAYSSSSITVSWDSVSGASSYYVYRADSYNGSYSYINSTSSTSYMDTGLSSNTRYYYKVSAYNDSNGEGPQSSYTSATTSVAITVPSGLSLEESLSWIDNNAVEGGEYAITLNNDETIAPRTLSYSGQTVGITLTGGTTERTVDLSSTGSLFIVGSGVTLTLDNNVTLRGRSDNTAPLIIVTDDGRLVMNADSKVSGNTHSSISTANGSGVYVSGIFIMNSGIITGNTISSSYYGDGSGVYVSDSGTFTMSGGTISSNTAFSFGGGVFSSGNFSMSGGEISGNTAFSRSGGGVAVGGARTFTMSGGTISGNTASYGGGGVYVESQFAMSGGTISGNTVSTYGGGVYVASGTFAKQPGAIIYGSNESDSTLRNTAIEGDSYGHAVYVYVDGWSDKLRNTTADSILTLDSSVDGMAGGWETGEEAYCTVTFDADGGSPETQTKTVNNGDSIGSYDMPDTPTKSGYGFGGWYTSSGGGGTQFTETTTVTESITVYANWLNQYTVTFNADGGSPATQTKTVNDGSSVGAYNMPDDPTRSEYTFDGWYTSTGGSGTQFTAATTVTESITVYANWTVMLTTSLADALGWLALNAEEGGEYTIMLNANETSAPRTLAYNGKQVGITIKGDTSERRVTLSANGSLFSVGNGVTLTLDNNVTLQGRSGNTASLVSVDRGTLVMHTGSKITGNATTSTAGGGVRVYNNGTFTMGGGEISGNSASSSASNFGGGGVYVGNGTFTMSSGKISGNTASTNASYSGGGGVHINGGMFTMSGGEISGNSVSSSYSYYSYYGGGGVYVSSDGMFTMDGGVISGNSAAGSGGGVCVRSGGTFMKLTGATIYGSNASSTLWNSAYSSTYGYAVYILDGKKRNTTAGTSVILNSSATGSAGGWE
jgi:uncharacterized repeat protein (TIGR02543 family)